jgi:hypothetical protein
VFLSFILVASILCLKSQCQGAFHHIELRWHIDLKVFFFFYVPEEINIKEIETCLVVKWMKTKI